MHMLKHGSGLGIFFDGMRSCSGSIELRNDDAEHNNDDNTFQPPEGLIVFSNLSPYHTPDERNQLVKHWVFGYRVICQRGNLCKPSAWRRMKQPTDEIRNYLGEVGCKCARMWHSSALVCRSENCPLFRIPWVYG